MIAAQTFRIPHTIPEFQHVAYCVSIIQKLREEATPLREQVAKCHASHDPHLDTLRGWKDKYQQEQHEKNEWKRKYERAQKEIEKLQEEIEKLTKTKHRLNQAVFAHGNFHHPNSKDKKKNGGQYGHADTNQDKQRDKTSFSRKRIYATHCGKCGNPLSRVNSTNEKTYIDIHINTELIQMILESERQWCGNCQEEVNAQFSQALPFSEYGSNIFLMIMLLRFRAHQSIGNISEILFYGHGIKLAKSVILNILQQAKRYLQSKYDELVQAIRDGDLMYNDETGWMIKGEKATMWIMATADTQEKNGDTIGGKTAYIAAETKGKGVFEEMYGNSKARSMHDGNPSYEAITGEENSLYCWTHVIRFSFEETIKLESTHPACQIKERLVTLYQDIRTYTERTNEEKETQMREELDALTKITSDDKTVQNIQNRVKTQKEGLIKALLYTEDGTNNLAEREFRQLVISRNISYGSATFDGMATTAVLSSITQTIHRDKQRGFLPTLREYLTAGIKDKYPQYAHSPSFSP